MRECSCAPGDCRADVAGPYGTSRSRTQIVNVTLGTLRPQVRSVIHWGWRMG